MAKTKTKVYTNDDLIDCSGRQCVGFNTHAYYVLSANIEKALAEDGVSIGDLCPLNEEGVPKVWDSMDSRHVDMAKSKAPAFAALVSRLLVRQGLITKLGKTPTFEAVQEL